MGFCHYGNQTFFDSDGNGTDAQSAVETLKGALALGKGALNPAALGQVAGLLTDGVKGLAQRRHHRRAREGLPRTRDQYPQGRYREDRRSQHGNQLSRQAEDIASTGVTFEPSNYRPLYTNGHVQTVYAWAKPRTFPRLPPAVPRFFDVAPDARVLAHCHWHAGTGRPSGADPAATAWRARARRTTWAGWPTRPGPRAGTSSG